MSQRFSEEEIGILRTLFDSCDVERIGYIHLAQLPGLLSKLGKSSDDAVAIIETCSKIAENNNGQINFNNLIGSLEANEVVTEMPLEGADPKVLEFLKILEDYRVKCEEEGNYLEAGRAHKQLSILRKQEEKRQQKAVKARQIAERQDVQLAHNLQFNEFNASWDRYMQDYDSMAQNYIQQMTERHAIVLLEFQKQLRMEIANKPPKWSKELLEMRRMQHIHARNRNYTEAQKLKIVCDRTEERERQALEETQAIVFARREAKFRHQQQAELQALLKRIEGRRKEHIKQRAADSKRLLQRNRNVQSVLESKQNLESQRIFDDIKKTLVHSTSAATSSSSSSSSMFPTIKNPYSSSSSSGSSSSMGPASAFPSSPGGFYAPSVNPASSAGASNAGMTYQQQEQQQQYLQYEQQLQQQQQYNERNWGEQGEEEEELNFQGYNQGDQGIAPDFLDQSGPDFSQYQIEAEG